MQKAKSIKDWDRMYKNLTDKDQQAENRRKTLRKKRMEMKINDTGL